MLVLADRDARISRIQDACNEWDAEACLHVIGADRMTKIDTVSSRACDLAILDHGDPVESRLQAIKHLLSLNDSMRVIVTGIPAGDSEERTELIFSYLEAGAAGYISEDRLEADLSQVIQEVQRGGTWIEPTMTIELIQRTVALHDALEMMKPYSAVSGQADMLTRRQQEVLELLAAGLTNKEIADELFISVGTVKNHVHRILDVLRASSREQAAQYYQFLQAPSATT
jgi:DNA-binding NarL/FixJ family response regulator